MQKKKMGAYKTCRECRTSQRNIEPNPVSFRETTNVSEYYPPLAIKDRWMIVSLHRLGRSTEEIAKILPCDERTVRTWVERFEETEDVKDITRKGRKRKTTEIEDDNIIETAVQNPFTTPKMIKRRQKLVISAKTIRRRLNERGIHGCVAKKEYPFTRLHIDRRLRFANDYKLWEAEKWDRVLFSDEAIFQMYPQGQVWVQRPPKEAWNPKYLAKKVAHSPSVMVWACISGRGLGSIELLDGTVNGKKMLQILQQNLLKSSKKLFPGKGREIVPWWFQQDNAPAHSSRLVQTWLHRNGIQCIRWPPHSPDLNIIENLWGDLKHRVEARNPTTLQELITYIKIEWEETHLRFLQKLSHSMPKRCADVIESNGHLLKY